MPGRRRRRRRGSPPLQQRRSQARFRQLQSGTPPGVQQRQRAWLTHRRFVPTPAPLPPAPPRIRPTPSLSSFRPYPQHPLHRRKRRSGAPPPITFLRCVHPRRLHQPHHPRCRPPIPHRRCPTRLLKRRAGASHPAPAPHRRSQQPALSTPTRLPDGGRLCPMHRGPMMQARTSCRVIPRLVGFVAAFSSLRPFRAGACACARRSLWRTEEQRRHRAVPLGWSR